MMKEVWGVMGQSIGCPVVPDPGEFNLIISPTEYEQWQLGEGLWFRVLGPMPKPSSPPEHCKWVNPHLTSSNPIADDDLIPGIRVRVNEGMADGDWAIIPCHTLEEHGIPINSPCIIERALGCHEK